eukprot:GHVH01010923.1.p1 GENE.GHVH01010923.1~~GHVH01010923.1.p1  ORF type:complete len:397 (+),score=23.47 GHVH01010923.1:111-1301(+)
MLRSNLLWMGNRLGGTTIAEERDLVGFPLTELTHIYSGVDMGKKDGRRLPEGLGSVVALAFLMAAYSFAIFERLISSENFLSKSESIHNSFNIAMNSITFMVIYGIMDDILDMGWTSKILLPFGPYLVAMLNYQGPTAIVLPQFLNRWGKYLFHVWLGCDKQGSVPIQWQSTSILEREFVYPMVCLKFYENTNALDFGWMFLVWGALVYLFCVNSINIYAGINGLEVGQSIILAITLLVHVVLCSLRDPESMHLIWCASMLVLFILISFPLFTRNYFPAAVFVGNSYTTFSGVFFASLAFLGHQNRILIPLFSLQLINALISIPQLLRIVPCPRHRVPISTVIEKTGEVVMVSSKNLTLINVVLEIFGPLTEKCLVNVLLSMQVLAGTLLIYWVHI